jgi:hypothetical protein
MKAVERMIPVPLEKRFSRSICRKDGITRDSQVLEEEEDPVDRPVIDSLGSHQGEHDAKEGRDEDNARWRDSFR